jgi:hypothetical protein
MTVGVTGSKAVTKEIAYNLKLFVDEKVWAKMEHPRFSIEKVNSGSVKTIFPALTSPDARVLKTTLRKEKVMELNGVTKGSKAVAFWNPDFLKSTTFELDESPTTERVEEKYYFIAKIDNQETKSGEMELTFPLTLYLKDGEEPLDGVRYAITFSDGTKREGSFSKGFVKFGSSLGQVYR